MSASPDVLEWGSIGGMMMFAKWNMPLELTAASALFSFC